MHPKTQFFLCVGVPLRHPYASAGFCRFRTACHLHGCPAPTTVWCFFVFLLFVVLFVWTNLTSVNEMPCFYKIVLLYSKWLYTLVQIEILFTLHQHACHVERRHWRYSSSVLIWSLFPLHMPAGSNLYTLNIVKSGHLLLSIFLSGTPHE